MEIYNHKLNKPPVRPKPAYLRGVWCGFLPRKGGAWARRLRLALASDLVQGRCRAADSAITAMNNHFNLNNKALQEACSVLEEQLTDLEKLADIHELKNKDLESEFHRMRAELDQCRSKLEHAQIQASEYSAAANLAAAQHEEAREQAAHANCQIDLLREKLESRENRVCELEARVAELEGAVRGHSAALEGASRRMRALQEECAAVRTRSHQHHQAALELHAHLQDTQEELAAAREAAEAATAWWRTRETKTDATLRQQTKLIDFLQAKVEEAGRKKCSLSNKLFGRSGRRNAASPPLRRANRELREEVERLRTKLAASNSSFDVNSLPPTPRRETNKINKTTINRINDTPDGPQEDSLLLVWPDSSRERMRAQCADGTLVLRSGERQLRAALYHHDANDLPQNEANRAFTVKIENDDRGSTATIVCASLAERSSWLSRLHRAPPPAASLAYQPVSLARYDAMPTAALFLAPDATAIGSVNGLHSLRGAIRIEWESEVSPPRRTTHKGVSLLSEGGARAGGVRRRGGGGQPRRARVRAAPRAAPAARLERRRVAPAGLHRAASAGDAVRSDPGQPLRGGSMRSPRVRATFRRLDYRVQNRSLSNRRPSAFRPSSHDKISLHRRRKAPQNQPTVGSSRDFRYGRANGLRSCEETFPTPSDITDPRETD